MNLLLESVLEAHPHADVANTAVIVEAVESLALCQQVCLACADACLAEESVEDLRGCIRMDLDCSAACAATSAMLLRHRDVNAPVLHAQLHACVAACQACSDLCGHHAIHYAHCAICAEACRRCQEKCNLALGELSPAGIVASE
ncbi:MAG: hypothetical protein JWM88_281 [Verrucomicrobia bacterium]|nr:hypothetical protein [Verrucomicrobiota bacterium]